ncbi:MAG: SCP2 sterol-binding domain-containing protein [bacterium]
MSGPGGGTWTMDVGDGKMEVRRGEADAPTCVVRLYARTFKQIVSKEIDGMTAMNSGLMQVEGNEADVAMLAEVMG